MLRVDMPKVHPLRDTAVALGLAAVLGAQAPSTTVLDRPGLTGDAVFGTEDGQRWLTCRVVDGISGAGIAGAEVLLLAEANAPVGGELPLAMRLVADADGVVVARVDEGADGHRPWSWMCARASGYGQRMAMGSFDEPIVRLSPGATVRAEVRDWRDQPVPGVLVGFCSGCGHTPDLVHGRTDAAGRITLPGVDVHAGIADFYLVHPALDLGYLSPDSFPGRLPMVLRTDPGIAHRGVVVDPSGRPVAGASVGASTVHRGPWTRTAADGSFTLCGLSEPMDLWVHVAGRRILFEEDGVDSMRLQLPDVGGDNEEGVQVVDLTDEQRARREERRAREQARAAAQERSWPQVSVRAVGLPEDGTVTLRTRSRAWDVTDAVASGEPVRIPDEPAVFWLYAEDTGRVFPVDRREAAAAGVVRLPWFAPTRIEGRVLDEDGESLAARAYVGPPGSSAPDDRAKWQAVRGALSLPTDRTGPSWLFLEAADHPGTRILTIDLPARGDDAHLELGDVVVRGQPAHRFERSDGTPLEDGSVHLLRAGWMDFDGSWAWRFEADADGHFWLPDLEPGDALLVRSAAPASADLEDVSVVGLPSRFVVGAAPPAVFRMHGGELRLEVAAGDEHVYATIGDRVVPVDGPTVVRGLEVRSHDVWIGAGLRRGVAARVDVTDPARGSARRLLSVRVP
jgi:hypothetical protein